MSTYNFEAQPSEELVRAPRRFKTAFIFFSSARHKEMKEELALEGKAEKVSVLFLGCSSDVADFECVYRGMRIPFAALKAQSPSLSLE